MDVEYIYRYYPKKHDICTFNNTNIGKNLIYQAIPIMTLEKFVFFILSIIVLIEDQVIAIL